MSHASHPARSLDFLSRLHDGELSAAEKAHFESHRSHCDECRKAAADFEQTLASFRIAGTSPAASDLSARILRRLQTGNRRRPTFGVVFGIDLRWAGAFTAALVAVILGASLVERQRAVRSIPVSFAAPSPAPASAMADALAKKEALASQTFARQSDVSPKDRAATTPGALATSFQAVAATPASSADKTAQVVVSADAPVAAPAPPAPAQRLKAKPSRARDAGGEGAASEEKARPAAADTFEVRGEAPLLAPARLTVTALDDGGLAPALLNGGKVELSDADRGRYVITVGADGLPLDVARESVPATAKMIAAAPPAADPTLRTLKQLRFAPGSRARRLLAQIE